MSPSKTKKTEAISVRLLPSERAKLTEIATAEDRTLSQVLRRLLRSVGEENQTHTSMDYRLGC